MRNSAEFQFTKAFVSKEDAISGAGTAWHIFKPSEIAVVYVQGKVPCLINLLNEIAAQVHFCPI